jgi:hypothetical protein
MLPLDAVTSFANDYAHLHGLRPRNPPLVRELAGSALVGRGRVKGAGEDRRPPKRSASDGRDGVGGAGHGPRLSRGRRVPNCVRAIADSGRRGFSGGGPLRGNQQPQTRPCLLARRLPRRAREGARCRRPSSGPSVSAVDLVHQITPNLSLPGDRILVDDAMTASCPRYAN